MWAWRRGERGSGASVGDAMVVMAMVMAITMEKGCVNEGGRGAQYSFHCYDTGGDYIR